MGSGTLAWQPDDARERAPKDGERRTGSLAVDPTLPAVVANLVVVVVVVIVVAAVAVATAAALYRSTRTTSSHTRCLSRQNRSQDLDAAHP